MVIKIHKVSQEPHFLPDLDRDCMCIICTVEYEDGEVTHDFELYSSDFDFLYSIVKHTKANIKPFEIDEKSINFG